MKFQTEIKQRHITSERNTSWEYLRDSDTAEDIHEVLFVNAAAKYLSQSHGENVPYQLQIKKKKSLEHTKDIERVFATLLESWHWKGRNVKNLRLTDIDAFMGGDFLEFMQKQKNFENRTINKYVGNLKPFHKWCIKEYGTAKNWLEGIEKLPETYSSEIMSYKDFIKLINKTKPENGIQFYDKGAKESRNFYRAYLISAFKWSVNSPLRREELINLKHSDVKDLDGYSIIKTQNIKVDRIQGRQGEAEKTYVIFPVTPDIRKLLYEADHEHFKGTDKYILAPNLIKNRVRSMKDGLSRGFNHFYKLDHPDGKLTFKSLRKTYLTNLNKYLGNEAFQLTHSNQEVLDKHYLNKEKLAGKAKDFGTYHEELRKEQVQTLRASRGLNQSQSNSHEIDK
ncbi:MAG TPA: phage integrase SAM-like domain-containing protein [Bacteroidia bacterium]|nr:phage integrase SAM-like domain-containing protein [Bacteroidia bacterium]